MIALRILIPVIAFVLLFLVFILWPIVKTVTAQNARQKAIDRMNKKLLWRVKRGFYEEAEELLKDIEAAEKMSDWEYYITHHGGGWL